MVSFTPVGVCCLRKKKSVPMQILKRYTFAKPIRARGEGKGNDHFGRLWEEVSDGLIEVFIFVCPLTAFCDQKYLGRLLSDLERILLESHQGFTRTRYRGVSRSLYIVRGMFRVNVLKLTRVVPACLRFSGNAQRLGGEQRQLAALACMSDPTFAYLVFTMISLR